MHENRLAAAQALRCRGYGAAQASEMAQQIPAELLATLDFSKPRDAEMCIRNILSDNKAGTEPPQTPPPASPPEEPVNTPQQLPGGDV